MLGILPSPEFVEERRVALERYLQALSRLSSISAVHEWWVFIGVGPEPADQELSTISRSGRDPSGSSSGGETPAEPTLSEQERPDAHAARRDTAPVLALPLSLSLLPLEGAAAAVASGSHSQGRYSTPTAFPAKQDGHVQQQQAQPGHWVMQHEQQQQQQQFQQQQQMLQYQRQQQQQHFMRQQQQQRTPPASSGSGGTHGSVQGELHLFANHFSAPVMQPAVARGKLEGPLTATDPQYFAAVRQQQIAPAPRQTQQQQQQQQHAQARQFVVLQQASFHGGSAGGGASPGHGGIATAGWNPPASNALRVHAPEFQPPRLVVAAPGDLRPAGPALLVPAAWYVVADDIVGQARGSAALQHERTEASLLLAQLVRQNLGAYAFAVGPSATDTALVSEAVTLSAFVHGSREQGWAGRLLESLLKLASSQTPSGGLDDSICGDAEWKPPHALAAGSSIEAMMQAASPSAVPTAQRKTPGMAWPSPEVEPSPRTASASATDAWTAAAARAPSWGGSGHFPSTRSSSSLFFSGPGSIDAGTLGSSSFALPPEQLSLEHAPDSGAPLATQPPPPLSLLPDSLAEAMAPLPDVAQWDVTLQWPRQQWGGGVASAGQSYLLVGHAQEASSGSGSAQGGFDDVAIAARSMIPRHSSVGSSSSGAGGGGAWGGSGGGGGGAERMPLMLPGPPILSAVRSLFPPPPELPASLLVRSVTVHAGRQPRLHCRVNAVGVDVLTNSVHGLCMAAVVEAADTAVSSHVHLGHLFKRSLVLLRVWATYDLPVLVEQHHQQQQRRASQRGGGDDATSAEWAAGGVHPAPASLPWGVCVTLLLWMFLRHGRAIGHPLEAVLTLFADLARFPFGSAGVSVYGALPRTAQGAAPFAGGPASPAADAGADVDPSRRRAGPGVCDLVSPAAMAWLLPDSVIERSAHRVARAASRPASADPVAASPARGALAQSEPPLPSAGQLRLVAFASAASRHVRDAIVILDPLDPSRNLARSVTAEQGASLKAGFEAAAAAMESAAFVVSDLAHTSAATRDVSSSSPQPFSSSAPLADALPVHRSSSLSSATANSFSTSAPGKVPAPDTLPPVDSQGRNSPSTLPSGVFPVSSRLFAGGPIPATVDFGGGAADRIRDQLDLCGMLLQGTVAPSCLAAVGVQLLAEKGALPVGEVGKLLTEAVGLPSLSHLLKERFGGLKRFLEAHPEVFSLGGNHPFNPTVSLAGDVGPGWHPALTEMSSGVFDATSVLHY